MLRIEISSGGFGTPVIDFQTSLASFISDADSVISSFKTVRNSTCSLNGGVGSLQGALDDIESRIHAEETKKLAAEAIQTKANDFIQLAERVDRQVAVTVNQNKDAFYRVNPWLKPEPAVTDEAPWYEKVWNWLREKGEGVAEGIGQAWNWVKDTAVKAWNGLKEIYNEHKKIIDTVFIVVGAVAAIVAVVATGGLAGAALVPLLASIGFPAAVASVISATVAVTAVVSTIGASVLNIVDTWCEIDNPTFNAWQRGLNITSTLSNLLYSFGGIYNSIKGVSPSELKTFRTQNYTRDEIKTAVKQDACIKRFSKELANADNEYLVKGNYGEMLQDKQMRIAGYKRISNPTVSDYNHALGQGIDGVYSNGKSFVIGDAKYGSAQLRTTKDGLQMSSNWIENRLDAAVGFDIAEKIIDQGYTSQVFHVDRINPTQFWIEILNDL